MSSSSACSTTRGLLRVSTGMLGFLCDFNNCHNSPFWCGVWGVARNAESCVTTCVETPSAPIGAIRFGAAELCAVLVENCRSTRVYGLPEWPLRRNVWLHRLWGRFKLKPLTRVIPNAALGPPLTG